MTASEFSPPVLRAIRTGLYQFLSETDRYLLGAHTSEPTEHDTCCAYHLDEWTRRNEEQKNLQARRATIVEAIRQVNPLIPEEDWPE